MKIGKTRDDIFVIVVYYIPSFLSQAKNASITKARSKPSPSNYIDAERLENNTKNTGRITVSLVLNLLGQ